jgi:hypothetical protein
VIGRVGNRSQKGNCEKIWAYHKNREYSIKSQSWSLREVCAFSAAVVLARRYCKLHLERNYSQNICLFLPNLGEWKAWPNFSLLHWTGPLGLSIRVAFPTPAWCLAPCGFLAAREQFSSKRHWHLGLLRICD